MPTIAVIGSNSFTGAHVVDALLDTDNFDVLGVSRSREASPVFLPYADRQSARFKFHQIDIVKQFDALVRLLDEVQPEYTVFVAALSEVALSNERPTEYFDINTRAVVQLCEHLRKQPWFKRYIHFSSAEIYGPCSTPVPESHPFNPSTPYAVSKAAGDMYLATLVKNCHFPATVIRSTNVFGAYQQLYKIIPRTVAYAKLQKIVELHAGGSAYKSFIHIRDVTRGLVLALEADAEGVFHFSSESDETVANVVRMVCDQLGINFSETTKIVGERLGQDSRYWLDCSRAKSVLDWRPQISLTEGIRETVNWMERHWDTLKDMPLEYRHKI